MTDLDNAAAHGNSDQPAPDAALSGMRDSALDTVRALSRGNGMPPDRITLKSFDGSMVRYEAYVILHLAPSVTEKYAPGRLNGKILSSEAELRREIERAVEKAAEDPALRTAVNGMLRQRKDGGYEMQRQTLQLPVPPQQYAVHIKCQACHGSRATPCPACRATGHAPCTRCGGHREMTCPACRGTKYQSAQTQTLCARCHGRGRVGCTLCQSTGHIGCNRCRASGRLPCNTCTGTGWRTLTALLAFKAEARFEYDRNHVPPQALGVMDRLKSAFADGHAAVALVEDPARIRDVSRLARAGDVIVPYAVSFPYADAVFDFGGHEMTVQMTGRKPVMTGLGPFLEKLAGRGLKGLMNAARTKGDAGAELSGALRYRLVSEIVTAAASASPAKAAKVLAQRYPYGVGADRWKPLIRAANMALLNLTRRPRMIGLAAGLIAAAGLYTSYFILPLRALLADSLGETAAAAADFALLAGGGLLATLSAQIAARRTLNGVLSRLQPGKRGRFMPKAGESAAMGYGGAFILYVAVVCAALFLNPASPGWARMFASVAGF